MYTLDKIQKEKKRMHIVGKVISIIFYIILIPIIVINFTLIIKSFVNPNKTPDFFGYKNFVIVSGSMKPTIMIDDAILIKNVPEDEIGIGDIISFQQNEIIVTHRVIDIVDDNGVKKYQTKGDHNNTPDKQLVSYEQIEGKFQFKIKYVGAVIDVLKNKVTLLALVVIVVLISLYRANLSKRKRRRKEKRQLANNKD